MGLNRGPTSPLLDQNVHALNHPIRDFAGPKFRQYAEIATSLVTASSFPA